MPNPDQDGVVKREQDHGPTEGTQQGDWNKNVYYTDRQGNSLYRQQSGRYMEDPHYDNLNVHCESGQHLSRKQQEELNAALRKGYALPDLPKDSHDFGQSPIAKACRVAKDRNGGRQY